MKLRDHDPVVIDSFKGLYARGHADNVPLDHFDDCNNVKFDAGNEVATRDGIDVVQDLAAPTTAIHRQYNYSTQSGSTLLVLSYVGGIGYIYHIVDENITYGPILTVRGMSDFAFVSFFGRAYISPFTTYPVGSLNLEKGLQNEFLYVYAGDGTQARKAAGNPITGQLTIANGDLGHTDAGFHIFGFVAETASGYLTPPGALTTFSTSSTRSVSFGNIPTSLLTTITEGQFIPSFVNNDNSEDEDEESVFLMPDSQLYLKESVIPDELMGTLTGFWPSSTITQSVNPYVTKRHLVATKIIKDYNGDPTGYTFYFVPNATIQNNTDLFLNNVSFYDADLLDDASHLFDNYPAIPAGAVLTNYRDRLCLAATYNDISLILVSHPTEPEAISQIDGLIVVPLDGNPITNGQELRDVFYVTKRSRTVSYADNGDVPSSWPMVVIDNALGTPVHGIATVLDSGSSNVDYLIICTYQGITLFNGRYINPELTWKIEDYWKDLDRNQFRKIQIINAPIQKQIYVVLPTGNLLVGNYSDGLDPKSIRWAPWSSDITISSIAVWNIDEILIGAE